jgi:hypothetical protein
MTKEELINKILSHPNCQRSTRAAIKLIQAGVPLSQWNFYEKEIEKAYQIGKPKSDLYVKKQFARTKTFIEKTFKDIDISTNFLG